MDVVCCGLLVVSVLVPVLVVDGLVADGLIFFSAVEAVGARVLGLAQASFGAKLNGVGAGAVPTEGMTLNNVSPSMSIPKIFFAISEISLQTFDIFSMAPLLRFE